MRVLQGAVWALLLSGLLKAAEPDAVELAAIRKWVTAYDSALNAKDLDRLAAFYQSDVTIYEGGRIHKGWADYRDHRLGRQLRTFEDLQLSHFNVSAVIAGDHRTAYVTSEYKFHARVKELDISALGLETLVLVRAEDGPWKVRHRHTSRILDPEGRMGLR